jgi:hypothetical protein
MSFQKELKIKASDNKDILCLVNQAEHKKANKLVIMVHGMTGHPYEYIHVQAAHYFTKKGYDVARMRLYCGGYPTTRNLLDCTIHTHASDTNAVINHFKNHYNHIYAIGHSYGGITLIKANPEISAVSFWDSTLDPYNSCWKDFAIYLPELDCYQVNWRANFLVSKQMVEADKAYTSKDVVRIAPNLLTPIQCVLSTIDSESSNISSFIKALKKPKSLIQIQNTDHEFTKGDSIFEALEASENWFSQITINKKNQIKYSPDHAKR